MIQAKRKRKFYEQKKILIIGKLFHTLSFSHFVRFAFLRLPSNYISNVFNQHTDLFISRIFKTNVPVLTKKSLHSGRANITSPAKNSYLTGTYVDLPYTHTFPSQGCPPRANAIGPGRDSPSTDAHPNPGSNTISEPAQGATNATTPVPDPPTQDIYGSYGQRLHRPVSRPIHRQPRHALRSSLRSARTAGQWTFRSTRKTSYGCGRLSCSKELRMSMRKRLIRELTIS